MVLLSSVLLSSFLLSFLSSFFTYLLSFYTSVLSPVLPFPRVGRCTMAYERIDTFIANINIIIIII